MAQSLDGSFSFMPLDDQQDTAEDLLEQEIGDELPEPTEPEGEDAEAEEGQESPEGEATSQEAAGDGDVPPEIKAQLDAIDLLRKAGKHDRADALAKELDKELGIETEDDEPEIPQEAAGEAEWVRLNYYYTQQDAAVASSIAQAEAELRQVYATLKPAAEQAGYMDEQINQFIASSPIYARAWNQVQAAKQQQSRIAEHKQILSYVDQVAKHDPIIRSHKKAFGDAIADGAVDPSAPYEVQRARFREYARYNNIQVTGKPVDKAKVKAAVQKLRKMSVNVGKTNASHSNGRATTGKPATGTRNITKARTSAQLRGTAYEGLNLEG